MSKEKILQDLKTELGQLKDTLPQRMDERYSQLFEEFMREYELGLALHVICDFLLEPSTRAPSKNTLEKIRALHSAMRINDSCVAELLKKSPA